MSTIRDALRRFDGQRRCWTAGLERAALAWLARQGRVTVHPDGIDRKK